ncbi:hypothetical protein BH11PSE3_BH11PSE3_51000 [soil metagenome]
MAKSGSVFLLPLVRAALLGATALTLAGVPFTVREAAAKVGVTSATDGDPLGKPPSEAERVLRIGIDVQANELITTSANDRAHLVFLDGSSLTVGPNAQLTIDKFVFDPNTKTGELAISASKGVLRLVGGKISKTTPITITTPSSTIGIRGGITIMEVKSNQTDSTFVFGNSMTVRAGGQTQTATRPGSMIVTNFGAPPGMPTILSQGALSGQLGQLEGRRSGPASNAPSSSGGGSGGGANADQLARTSGFSATNSGQSVRVIAPGVPDGFGTGPGPRNRNPNDTIVTAVSNATTSNVAVFQQAQQVQQVQSQQQQLSQQPALPPPPVVTQQQVQQQASSQGGATTPALSDLPKAGTATFSGNTFDLNVRQLGTYTNVWTYATRSGVATVSVDGANFKGNVITPSTTSIFFQSANPIPSSNIPGRSIQIGGTFFQFGRDTTAGQVGGFAVTGNGGYSVNGGFFAPKQ